LGGGKGGVMDRLLWKKKLFGSANKWWLLEGMSLDDVYCAFQFSHVPNEEIALTDLKNPTITLEKWATSNDFIPEWNARDGFIFKSHGQNSKTGLENSALNSGASNTVQSIFAAYSNLGWDNSKGFAGANHAAVIAGFGGGGTPGKLWANHGSRDGNDNGFLYYACAPGFRRGSDGKPYHTNLSIVSTSSWDGHVIEGGGTVRTAKDKSYKIEGGVIGYSGREDFYVEGKKMPVKASGAVTGGEKGKTLGNNGINGIANGTSISWDGFYLKGVVAFTRALTEAEAIVISSALRSFL
jgi:hypothetical protein